jgi:hypothetical protein
MVDDNVSKVTNKGSMAILRHMSGNSIGVFILGELSTINSDIRSWLDKEKPLNCWTDITYVDDKLYLSDPCKFEIEDSDGVIVELNCISRDVYKYCTIKTDIGPELIQ